MSGDLADFLAEGGAVVGGGAAFGATVGFIAGSLVHDLRPQTDPDYGHEREALGGVAGLVALAIRGVDSVA